MRKLAAFLMVTLDGYHESADGDLSWHNVDGEFREFARALLDEADTLVFGRKTYEGMAAFWLSPASLDVDQGVADRMNRSPKIVVSRGHVPTSWGPTRLVKSDDALAQLTALKQHPGADILVLGSSSLAASLLDAGILDELRLMMNPVIRGSGHPLLAGARPAGLELTGVKQFASSNVLLSYHPAA